MPSFSVDCRPDAIEPLRAIAKLWPRLGAHQTHMLYVALDVSAETLDGLFRHKVIVEPMSQLELTRLKQLGELWAGLRPEKQSEMLLDCELAVATVEFDRVRRQLHGEPVEAS